ncbi:MAG TPA: MotA/TolQ/ExbB proton channel family protein [Pyrinomonadaceae bacterium]
MLTLVTKEEVTPAGLQESPDRYASILGKVLEGETEEGAFRIEYEGSAVGFAFTPAAEAVLRQVLSELKAPSSTPTPPDPPQKTAHVETSAPEESAEALTVAESVSKIWWPNLLAAVILLLMLMYSIAVMVERFLTYRAAKAQSREFAPRVAQALKNNRIEEAIDLADKHKKSHLALVVNAGLHGFRAHESSGELSGEEIDASKRAMQRAIAIKSAEFRRGLSGLATIGSTAWMVGLLGVVFGLIRALQSAMAGGSLYGAGVAAGVLNGLLTLALGFTVTVLTRWLHNYLAGKVEALLIEMNNAASELIDYFQKNRRESYRGA